MKSIAVFCGSADGYNEVYREAAYDLGKALAALHIRVVFGGARVGLMGALADGVLDHEGRITGVIPEFLKTKEVAHDGLTDLIIVHTMHERKMKMHDLCDGIIALPGGWGTMEELMEVLTWSQLGLHSKPVSLFNVGGYYDALIAFFDNMVQEGFLGEFTKNTLLSAGNIPELLQQMEDYIAPDATRWITKQTT